MRAVDSGQKVKKLLDVTSSYARTTLLQPHPMDKVASLRDQLRNGEYKVDTARLADKMLTEALNEELS
jgi:anti-sigma28 factor (negative regulator of flagellin synthesis)